MKFLLLAIALPMLAGPAGAQVQVPYERIRRAGEEPGNWLTYSGNYAAQRFSPLTQITPANVAGLKPAWVYQSHDAGKWEVSPLVVDGVLYITEGPGVVSALDGRTGRPLWNYRRAVAPIVPGCCGTVNRGLAALGDALYFCTIDCHLVCLDATTGHERWDSVLADYKDGHSITVAPLALKDKIIVGISGGEYGIRGFLDAYEAKSGRRAWRLWTIPGPGEPGHETWGPGDSWSRGGGTTWVTGSYDPELNLLYWGTGNPGPDMNGDARPGDNLYTDCMLAIEPETGKLRWHFQFTPHDLHDWDSNEVPVLVDAEVAGMTRQLLVQANRNGFYYVLDRVTGEFVAGAPFAKETWASGLDSRGRPVLIPGKEPTPEGVLVNPGLAGAVNWQSPSYNPRTGLVYLQGYEDNPNYFIKRDEDLRPGEPFMSGAPRPVRGVESYGVVKAIEATTGKIRWEFKLHAIDGGGVLSTAAGLVFSGSYEGLFFALDAQTGHPLWHFQTGGLIQANPVSFLVDGKQYVAVAAGQALFVFGL